MPAASPLSLGIEKGTANHMMSLGFNFKLLLFAFVFSGFAGQSLWAAGPTEITATVGSSGLVVTNNTSDDVYYEVHEETILSRIEWAPICTNENHIPPKKSLQIPANFEPSGKVYLFWWHKGKYLTDYEHYGPDKVRSFVIQKR